MSSKSTKPKKATAKRPADAAALVRWVAQESLLFCDPQSPFQAAVEEGAPGLVVVTGENAAGKSLYVRVAGAVVQQHDMTAVSISIRERTGAGSHEMSGMRRVFLFGDYTQVPVLSA